MEEKLDRNWQVVGAAVQGVTHQKLGLPCQDALDYLVHPNGALLIALADGAGSAEYADLGARCAVESALEALSASLTIRDGDDLEDLVGCAFHKARCSLEQLAEDQEHDLRDFATTLTCAVVLPERLAIGQLGDGAIVVKDAQEEYLTATRAQRGEYANETYFMTQEDALDRVEVQVIESPIRALAAMSDGMTRLALKMPSYEPHIPFFQPLFAFVEGSASVNSSIEAQMAAFLSSERVCARTDDDKALILAVRISNEEKEVTKDDPSQAVAGLESKPATDPRSLS